MERHRQSLADLRASLSALDTEWKDSFAERVIQFLEIIKDKPRYSLEDLKDLLDEDFESATTVFRLFLDKSKDEFTTIVKTELLEMPGTGRKAYLENKDGYIRALDHLLIREAIRLTINRKYSWKDIIVERLKSGRGSAIKGQHRGRALENFVEEIVRSVFGPGSYDKRCSFTGKSGQSTEKADFAIPSKEEPRIVIEVKAYGATGSKQTDVLGDVRRILEEKRHDTSFLFVTDGITWNYRVNDLRKLIQFQNDGSIYRIYTKKMSIQLSSDLTQLKKEHSL